MNLLYIGLLPVSKPHVLSECKNETDLGKQFE